MLLKDSGFRKRAWDTRDGEREREMGRGREGVVNSSFAKGYRPKSTFRETVGTRKRFSLVSPPKVGMPFSLKRAPS